MEQKSENPSEPKIINQKDFQDPNKILRNFFLFIGIVVVVFISWVLFSYFQSTFDYRGVEFAKVNEIAPYMTSLPVNYRNTLTGEAVNEETTYGFYLRNDPRELDSIPFNGEMTFLRNVVMNSTGEIKCGGMGTVGTANMANLYSVLGAKVDRDPNVSCDDTGRYTFIQIEPGEENKIKEIGNSCYLLTFKDCKVLPVTERFMIEMFVKLNEIAPYS